jgi:hypothetical protein
LGRWSGPKDELVADEEPEKSPKSREYADVAQLVEHFTRNEGVRGSSPRVGLALQSDFLVADAPGESFYGSVLEA